MAGQLPTKQMLLDAYPDLRTVDAVSNSKDPDTGAEIDTWMTRRGGQTDTLAGRLKALGIERVGDFTAGCTVTKRNQGVLQVGGSVYVWMGIIPAGGKIVPPNSSPASTGGISATAWVDIGDASLRSDLASSSGASMIGGMQVSRMTLSDAKNGAGLADGQVIHIIDLGYDYKFNPSRNLISGQPTSEITFDDELHVLVNYGGMLEFCDWSKLSGVETKNYAAYQAKLRGRSDQVSVGAIGDSTTFCQALPNSVGATNKTGQATGFGDGSTYADWQFNNHWPKVLGDIMQSAAIGGASVSNLGYSGDRALTGYLRHRVPTSNDASIIMFGINDVLYGTSNGANPDQIYDNTLYSLGNFQAVMRKMIARELLRGKTVVVLGTTVFGSLVGWDGSAYSANRLTEAYDTVAKSVSAEFGCLFVDVKSDIMRQYKLADVLQEGTHLNEVGCKVIAGRIAAVMLSRWKTPNVVSATSTVLSNPNVSDMIGKGQNGVLPNVSSNSPAFQTNEPTTIALSSGQPVFYPIYVSEDSLIVFPEMIGSAAGAQITFTVNGGAILPQKLNPRELGTAPAPSKGYNLVGGHIDESNQNYSSDAMFVALVVKGWHLLEVSKDSGSGSALLDSFQFYAEKDIREKHTRGLTAIASAGNTRNWRASSTSSGSGLYTITFDQPMSNADYHVEVDQSANNNAQFHSVHARTTGNFKIQFMSAAGSGSGLNFTYQDPLDFSVKISGGR